MSGEVLCFAVLLVFAYDVPRRVGHDMREQSKVCSWNICWHHCGCKTSHICHTYSLLYDNGFCLPAMSSPDTCLLGRCADCCLFVGMHPVPVVVLCAMREASVCVQ